MGATSASAGTTPAGWASRTTHVGGNARFDVTDTLCPKPLNDESRDGPDAKSAVRQCNLTRGLLTYSVAAAFRGDPESGEKGVRVTAVEINGTPVVTLALQK